MKNKNMQPTTIDERTWYYEEKKGYTLVHEVYKEDKLLKTVRLFIPRKAVEVLQEQREFAREILSYIPFLFPQEEKLTKRE